MVGNWLDKDNAPDGLEDDEADFTSEVLGLVGVAVLLLTPVPNVMSCEAEVDVVVVKGSFFEAAPGPLPTAGTEPTCFVVLAIEGFREDDDAAVGDDFNVVDEF